MKKLALALLAGSLLAACADSGPARRYDDNDYVTGSNLPRRGSMPGEVQSVDKNTVDDWQRARPGARGPGGG